MPILRASNDQFWATAAEGSERTATSAADDKSDVFIAAMETWTDAKAPFPHVGGTARRLQGAARLFAGRQVAGDRAQLLVGEPGAEGRHVRRRIHRLGVGD